MFVKNRNRGFTSAVFVMFFTVAPLWAIQGNSSSEYQIKAVCLYNFLKFVSWPEGTFKQTDSPFNVCILGNDPFGELLTGLESKQAQGHPVRVHTLRAPTRADLSICHLVFSELGESLTPFQREFTDRGVLTVTDSGDGGIIRFAIENRRVRFSIDPAAAHRARLKLSSQLLKLGDIHHSTGNSN